MLGSLRLPNSRYGMKMYDVSESAFHDVSCFDYYHFLKIIAMPQYYGKREKYQTQPLILSLHRFCSYRKWEQEYPLKTNKGETQLLGKISSSWWKAIHECK